MAIDPQIRTAAEAWLDPAYDETTRAEVQALLDSGDEEELRNRFGAALEFGTGGLRGIVGAGTNRMNRYTAGAASQGLAAYINAQVGQGNGSVAIAHDSRTHSAGFAREAAQIFAANGVKAHLFEALRPTPELSFAVRHLETTAGIVITASHNPKQYNGYKVSWSDGAQVIPPHDKGIIDEVRKVTGAADIAFADFDQAVAEGKIVLIGEEVDAAYVEALRAARVVPDLDPALIEKLKIVYSPLHGTGGTLVPRALADWGFKSVSLVGAQAEPDGTFPTAPKPNPEEREAMQMALAQAAEEGAGLVMATDPDADRIGIAVPSEGGEWELLTGNQAASLMAHFILTQGGAVPADGAVVKTIVTTELIARIAEAHGVGCVDVLTGFKWIGAEMERWDAARAAGQPTKTFLFGGEESYGYLVGTHARDKDAVVCACVLAEMAAWAKGQSKTLLHVLDDVFAAHGVHLESLRSLERQGLSGLEEIQAMMTKLREDPPEHIAGYNVDAFMDVQAGTVTHGAGGDSEPIDLPKSNVLHFTLHGGGKVVARPSGTEPKIKFYFGATEGMLPVTHRDQPLAPRKEAVKKILADLEREFLALVEG